MAAFKDLQSRNIYSTPCTFASDIILCVVASLLRCDDAGLGLEMNVFFWHHPIPGCRCFECTRNFLIRHTLRSFPHRSWIVINRHTHCVFMFWSLLLSVFLCAIFNGRNHRISKFYFWLRASAFAEHIYVFACCLVLVLSNIWKRTCIALWFCNGLNRSTATGPRYDSRPRDWKSSKAWLKS